MVVVVVVMESDEEGREKKVGFGGEEVIFGEIYIRRPEKRGGGGGKWEGKTPLCPAKPTTLSLIVGNSGSSSHRFSSHSSVGRARH